MIKYASTEAQQFDEKRFTKIDMMKNEHSVTFMLNFLPNQVMKAHKHPGRELYLLVLEGNGTFSIDGEDIEVTKGDVVHCDPEHMLGFTNTSEQHVSIFATMTKIGE